MWGFAKAAHTTGAHGGADEFRGKTVVELGAGCGLTGVAVCLAEPGQLLLTDYAPPVLLNLKEAISISTSSPPPPLPPMGWERYCAVLCCADDAVRRQTRTSRAAAPWSGRVTGSPCRPRSLSRSAATSSSPPIAYVGALPSL